MKVKYTKPHTDEYGMAFKPGTVAEHTDAEGARRVALGVCEQVSDEARSRVQDIFAAVSEECVPESTQTEMNKRTK